MLWIVKNPDPPDAYYEPDDYIELEEPKEEDYEWLIDENDLI